MSHLNGSIGLLTLLAVFGLLLPTVASAFSSARNLFAYDEQNQASMTYDGCSLSAFAYDSAAVCVADKKEIQTVGDAGLFAHFAEFAAKEAAPLIKAGAAGGETAGKAFPPAIKDAAKAENPLSTCVYCRREGTATQVDHAVPRSRGGDATLENAQLACPHCNASKGARDFPVNPPAGYRGEWPPSNW